MSVSVEKNLRLGHQWLRAGNPAEAERCFQKVVARDPGNARALQMLGLIAHRRGDHGPAIRFLEAAAAAAPGSAEIFAHLAEVSRTGGDPERAVESAREAVRLQPRRAPAHNNLGLALQDLGELEEAAAAFRAALAADPRHAKAWYNLANVQRQGGRLQEAEASLRESLELRPRNPRAWNALGVVLGQVGRFAEARAAFRRALEIEPQHEKAHYNLGNLLAEIDRPREALSSYDRALSSRPDYRQALVAKAAVLVRMEDGSNEGLRILEGLASRHPEDLRIHLALGEARFKRFDFAAAVTAYERALAIEPDLPETRANLTLCRAEICDWSQRPAAIDELRELVATRLAAGKPSPLSPHATVFFPLDPAVRLAIARRSAEEAVSRAKAAAPDLVFSHSRGGRERLRIGYLSSDFRDNALAHLTVRLYGLHDRQRFEVFGYSMGPDDGSSYRREIETRCDRFVELRGTSDAEAARRIHEDRVDLLVDLVGFAGGARPGIPALRPAPAQVVWLYPGSMGGVFHDYLVGDPVATPPDTSGEYGERLVLLPHCYQINDHLQEVPDDNSARREDLGLPEDAFVFCSFNTSAKIEPRVFDVWMRLLHAVPASVLWLLHLSVAGRENLRREAEVRGIDPGRLVFASHVPRADHLARLTLADLALDTFVCSGHTTTSDALWAGVPVVTCPGETFPSRVSASLLRALDVPELVTDDPEAYEELALRLALDREELKTARQKVQAKRCTAPLFDTPRFVRDLERAYQEMWERREEGSREPIAVGSV